MADEAGAGGANGGEAGAGAAGGGAGAGEAGGAAALFGDGGAGAAGAGDGEAAGGGAAAGGEVGGAAGGEAGAGADAAFLEGLSNEAGDGETSLREWAKSAGVKDANHMAKLLRDNMAAVRNGGKISVPGEGATADEVRAYHTAIGVPEDAAGYTVAEPTDGAGNPIPLDTDTLGRLAQSALKAGIPKAGFEALAQDFAKMQIDEMATVNREALAKADAIAKGWGDAKAENMAAIDRAVEALGLTSAEVATMRNVIGPERFIERMLLLGKGVSESKLFGEGGRPPKFGMSASEAQAKIDQANKTEGFAAKASVKGTPEARDWNLWNDVVGADANRKALEV